MRARLTPEEQAERDGQIVYRYCAKNEAQADIGAAYGITKQRVSNILREQGINIDLSQRLSMRAKQRWRSGAFKGVRLGRREVWPDCPPELQTEFKALARYVGKVHARRTIEGSRS